MSNLIKKLSISASLSILIIGVGLSPANIFAASSPQSSQGLSVSPPLVNASSNPGQSVVINIRVQNISGSPLILSSVAQDFGAKGQDGTPQILFNETSSTRYSLKYWITPINSPTIAPNSSSVIPVTVNIPANAEPGGHYGIIQFTGKPPTLDTTGVGVSASIGVLVLFTVNGTITHNLSSLGTQVSQNSKIGTFFQSGPLSISELIQNTGAVHEEPTGNITVKNFFGSHPITLPFNSKKSNILPGSVRKFTQDIKTKNLFGYYTISGNLAYGEHQTLSIKPVSFWVIPVPLVIMILVLVVLIFFILKFGIKRYNSYVIEQARRR